MNKKWLILDCNFLCHRVKHSMGQLSYGGKPTEIIYGFLKYLPALQDLFNISDMVFCWDSRTSKREEIFPEYKQTRRDRYKDLTEEEVKFEKRFRYQMKKLRTEYLKTIGFKNVFWQRGYESDDIIASVCNNLSKWDEAIIVSSDQDLYQLISPKVSFYNVNTNRMLTFQNFKYVYNILPTRWGLVKALAGCSTDGVPGIKGVGERTAIKYLLGKLKQTTKARQAISSPKGITIFNRNKKLVILPYPGVDIFRLKGDKITEEGWKEVTESLGMNSIRDRIPFRKVTRRESKADKKGRLL